MKSKQIQAVRGMNDVLPDEAPLWEFFEDSVRGWLRAYGYRNIRLPILERTELFRRSIGEVTDIVEKEMFTFVDQSNESLTLRPEGTASCARALVEHGVLASGGPQRLYYIGPMFRHERPQKGRFRQFHQVGVEAFGFSGPDIDAEQIVMCSRLWQILGLDGITLQLNTLGNPEARELYRNELVAYFQVHRDKLDSDSKRRLTQNPLRILDSKNPEMQSVINSAPTFSEFLDSDSINHFEKLKKYLSQNKVAFEVNPRLVRGLDYYNKTVFEWVTKQLGAQGAICAGGRYDGLVDQLGGPRTPACGFAIGTERTIELIKMATRGTEPVPIDFYIVRAGGLADEYSLQVAEQLRTGGNTGILHVGGGSLASQLRKASASSATYAVIIGDDEAGAGMVSVKPLREAGEQRRVAVAEAIDLIKKRDS